MVQKRGTLKEDALLAPATNIDPPGRHGITCYKKEEKRGRGRVVVQLRMRLMSSAIEEAAILCDGRFCLLRSMASLTAHPDVHLATKLSQSQQPRTKQH
jgi:hypothetical protein